MNMHDLEAFVAVVETGSIVAASVRLNLTQPGVTRRIQNLEESLGAVLLDRLSKPLRPTSAGREAYEHSRRVLRSIEDLKTSLSPQGSVCGEFRLAIAPYLSHAALAQPLDTLRSEFPQLSIRVTHGWPVRLMDQLARSEIDAAAIGLVEGVDPPEDLAGDDFGTQPVLIVAAHSLGAPKHATVTDLACFSWITNENGCGLRAFLKQKFEAARLPFTIAVETLNADLRMSLVARGLGVGIVTPAAFAQSPWREAIVIIETPDFRLRVRNWMLHRPPAGRLARPIAVFRDALIEALKTSPPNTF